MATLTPDAHARTPRSAAPRVSRPALIVHAFAPVGLTGPDGHAADGYLRRLWDAGKRFGMAHPLLDGVPTTLPTGLPATDEPAFAVLAAMTAARDDRVAQAICFERHDVLGVCIALGSTANSTRMETWKSILDSWRTASGDHPAPPSVLGVTLSFTAQVHTSEADIAKTYGAPVRKALQAAGLDCWDVPFRTSDGFTLWDWQDAARRRIVVALSTPDDEDELSRWLWWQDERELSTFGRYLLNSSKLVYESRVYEMTRKGVLNRVRSADARVSELRQLHDTNDPIRLQAAQRRLAQAQMESSELAIEMTRLKALQRTVGIAKHNLALTSPAPGEGQRTSSGQMFQRDQALATWLESQIEQDLGYAQGAIERAREAQNTTQVRLQQQLAQLTRAQSRVVLLQTSLVASLLATFTAVSVLKVDLSTFDSIRNALAVAVVSIVFALPPLAAHWFERYGVIDFVAGGFCAAACGYAIGSAMNGLQGQNGLVPAITGLLGLMVGLLLVQAHNIRLDARNKVSDSTV